MVVEQEARLAVGRVAMNGSLRSRAALWLAVRRSGARLCAPFRVTGRGGPEAVHHVTVGPGTRIGQFAWLSLTSPDARIVVGRDCTLNSNLSITVNQLVEIGDEVGIGDRTIIMDHEHAPAADGSGGFSWQLTPPRPVRIGSGAHLGVNVVVMPGVEIGENARVGANAVVTRSVPAGATVVGIPARILTDGSAG